MISIALASLEIVLILLGIGLLYWWTNKEANEAGKRLNDRLLASEEDYLKLMVRTAETIQALQPKLLTR